MTATQTLGLTASGRRAVTFTAFAVGSVSHFTFLITILYAEDNQYRRGIREHRQPCSPVSDYCRCLLSLPGTSSPDRLAITQGEEP